MIDSLKYFCPNCSPPLEPSGAIDRGIEHTNDRPDWPALVELEIIHGHVEFIKARCENCVPPAVVSLQSTANGWVEIPNINLELDRGLTDKEKKFEAFLASDSSVSELYANFLMKQKDYQENGYPLHPFGLGVVQIRIKAGDFDLQSPYGPKQAALAAALQLKLENSEVSSLVEIPVVKVSWWKRVLRFLKKGESQ